MDAVSRLGQDFRMKSQELNAFVRGLRVVMEADGWKMKPLSEAAGMGETAIKDLFRYQSAPKVTTAHQIATALGRSIDEIIAIGSGDEPGLATRLHIAVAGRVGAGAQVSPIDDHAKGDGLYHVICPPQISPRGVVAVEVLGDSMEPVYFEGDVLFYTRPAMGVPTEAIGRPCICEDANGFVWVKQVKIGTAPGLFNLLSINPAGSNRLDVPLTWAAPVLLHLPKAYVRRA